MSEVLLGPARENFSKAVRCHVRSSYLRLFHNKGQKPPK